jgi:hypothetical protein
LFRPDLSGFTFVRGLGGEASATRKAFSKRAVFSFSSYLSLDCAMSRNREPREFERHLFHDAYIDETSQSGPRFLAIGGIVITRKYAEEFERAIIAARGTRLPLHHPNGNIREIKWRSCGNGDFEAYKNVVDTFFDFQKTMEASTANTCKFHCTVVDTHVPGRSYSVGEKGQAGFSMALHYHCLMVVGSFYKQRLFHFYLDERTTSPENTPAQSGFKLNRALMKDGDKRDYPIRRMQFRNSKKLQALQLTDVLLGALTYRFNRHYKAEDANADKKLLCDYILDRGGVTAHLRDRGFISLNWGPYTFHIRKHREVKTGPAALHPDARIPIARVPTKGRASDDGSRF